MSCLTINGCVGACTGWSQHLARIASHLSQTVNVAVRPIRYQNGYGEIPLWLEAMTTYEIPDCPNELILYTASQEPTYRKRTAYFTMHETDRLHPFGVSNLNRSELVIVPSKWNRDTFRKDGVKVKIEIVPLGVDHEIFTPEAMRMDGPTVFGCAGRPQHGVIRKGVNLVMEAFQKAFTANDKAVLHVKSLPDEEAWIVPENSPAIVPYRKYMTDGELHEWLSSLTCFVSGAAGEGWGLLQNQAMATGRPVLASIYGGLTEFMTPDNSYACDYDIVPAAEKYTGWGNWASPRLEHMIELMRAIHQSREEAVRKGMQAAQDVAPLTWENSCQKLSDKLKEAKFL